MKVFRIVSTPLSIVNWFPLPADVGTLSNYVKSCVFLWLFFHLFFIFLLFLICFHIVSGIRADTIFGTKYKIANFSWNNFPYDNGEWKRTLYIDWEGPYMVWTLKKAPRQWYKCFDMFIVSHGYMRCEYDCCAYFKLLNDGSHILLYMLMICWLCQK